MIRQLAAKRYAEAAYQLARERGTVEPWSEALALMAAAFRDPQMAVAMDNARIPLAAKLSLVERTLAGIDPLALNLARLLVAKGRTDLIPQIAEAFQEKVDEERGIAHALVMTAVPLSPEEEAAIVAKLKEITGKEIALETQVDEGIVGGLVVRIGDRLIDGSTKSKLLALRKQLQEARA